MISGKKWHDVESSRNLEYVMQLLLNLDPAFPPRARVWLGELPSLPTGLSQVLQREIQLHQPPRSSRSMAAIEIFIPYGGRFSYGLLGGEFTPSDSKQLVVQVTSGEGGQIITDRSLARGLDVVRNGLPPWVAEEILSAASENVEIQTLGPGCLRFLGAHGEIGSSRWVFRGLANAVISLITMDSSLSEVELWSILRRHFSTS